MIDYKSAFSKALDEKMNPLKTAFSSALDAKEPLEEHKKQAEGEGGKTVEPIVVTFTLDPKMIRELGKAMPKGAKQDDRSDLLDEGDAKKDGDGHFLDKKELEERGKAADNDASTSQTAEDAKPEAGSDKPDDKDAGDDDANRRQPPPEESFKAVVVGENGKVEGLEGETSNSEPNDGGEKDETGEPVKKDSGDDDPPKGDNDAEPEIDANGNPVNKDGGDGDDDDTVYDGDSEYNMGLDEAISMDSRHTDTPLENCRAKDPMFCPYHGTKAMEKMVKDAIVEEFKKASTTPPTQQFLDMSFIPALSVTVEKGEGKNAYKLTAALKGSWSNEASDALQAAVDGFLATKGIKNASNASSMFVNNAYEAKSDIELDESDSNEEKLTKMNEWVDNLVTDYGDDPNSDISDDDLVKVMENLEAVQTAYDALQQNPSPATEQTFKKTFRDAEDFYHMVRGVADLTNIKTPQDAQKMRDDLSDRRKKAGDWHNMVEEAADVWQQVGVPKGARLPKYPQGAQAIRQKFQKQYGNLWNSCCKKYADADAVWQQALQAGDLKAMKGALHSLDFASQLYEDLMPSFTKTAQEYLDAAKAEAKAKGITLAPYQPKPWTP